MSSFTAKTTCRPKISVYIATSIDGYIAREDGGLDWLDRVGGFDEESIPHHKMKKELK